MDTSLEHNGAFNTRQNRRTPWHVAGAIGVALGLGMIVVGAVAQQSGPPGGGSGQGTQCFDTRVLGYDIDEIESDCQLYVMCPKRILCWQCQPGESCDENGPQENPSVSMIVACETYSGGTTTPEGDCVPGSGTLVTPTSHWTLTPIGVQNCPEGGCGGSSAGQ